jgi:hypothetical protein
MADLAMLLPEDNNERVCAMQLDISNAFNEMPRGKVAEEEKNTVRRNKF